MKTARLARDNASVQLRRAILKASGSRLAQELHAVENSAREAPLSPPSTQRSSSAGDLLLYQKLEASNVQYQERLSALGRFNAKSKASTKQTSLKTEWIKELQHLRGTAHSTERDVASLLEVLVLHSPSDLLIQSLVEDSFGLANDRKGNESDFISQIRDLKGFFKDTAKSLADVANKKNEQQQQQQGEVKLDPPPVASIFADLLMQLRSSQTSQLGSLAAEERQLSAEIAQTHRVIVSMLQQDRLNNQNENFINQLRLEEGDDQEVALVLEEWYAKLEVLDRAHASELALLKQERAHLDGDNWGGGSLGFGNGLEEEAGAKKVDNLSNGEGEGEGEGEDKVGTRTSKRKNARRKSVWSEKDRLAFAKIYNHCQVTGNSRKKLLAQLSLQLAHIPRAEVERHETWYRACVALNQKRKNLISGHVTARENLIQQAKSHVDAFREQRHECALAAKRLAAHEASREQLHKVLETLRAARNESDAQLRAMKEREKAEQIEEAQREALALQAEHDWKKKQVDIYKQVRKQMQDHLKHEEDRLKEEARIAHLAVMQVNKERVAARKEEWVAKEEAKRRKELQHLENEARKMDFLMRLASQVPYYDEIQNISSKLDHVTAAAHAQEYLGAQQEHRGFMRPTGFADAKIITDARFRLAEALRDANVIQSKAARPVIAQFHPRPHLAIHGILTSMAATGAVI